MRKQHIGLLIFLMILPVEAGAQCPTNIYFNVQSEIDAFPSAYPGCTAVTGLVEIQHVSNLDSLSSLVSIGGHFYISSCNDLEDLHGLDNLTHVGGDFIIQSNSDLMSLDGLQNFTSAGATIWVDANHKLTDLNGLQHLTTVDDDLIISGCDRVKNLQGLEQVTHVGGNFEAYSNDSLQSLTGIDNIVTIGDDLHLVSNPMLTWCAVQSICNYLINPGSVVINWNESGCASQAEVEAACLSLPVSSTPSVEQAAVILPNPASNYFFISGCPAQSTIEIMDAAGKPVLTSLHYSGGSIVVSSLPGGIYSVIVKKKNGVKLRLKLIRF